MKKKKDTELVDALNGEAEVKELPEELEAQDGNQTDEAEEDMLEEIDLFIPGDEEEEERKRREGRHCQVGTGKKLRCTSFHNIVLFVLLINPRTSFGSVFVLPVVRIIASWGIIIKFIENVNREQNKSALHHGDAQTWDKQTQIPKTGLVFPI